MSFSGGKDSTVLLDICRRIYPDIAVVFCDTGLEYPEIREFVKGFDGVTWLKPKMTIKQVIRKFGYPVISKEQSQFLYEYRNTKSEYMRNLRLNGNKSGQGKIKNKYRYLIDAPFKIGYQCCDIMKKNPFKSFEKKTGMVGILGTMTEESSLRKTQWFAHGCNAFDLKRPYSRPMSFWTEQDVLQYIVEHGLQIAPVYGEVVADDGGGWHTTGQERTGCVACAFGAQYDEVPNRFHRLKEMHPKIYDYCMRPMEQGGLGMAEVLDFIGIEH